VRDVPTAQNTRLYSLVLSSLLVVAAMLGASADASDRIQRVIPVQPDTPLSVEITVGDVVVRGWDRNEVSVEIVRRAPDSGRLSAIPAEVEQRADGLVIRAVQIEAGRDANLRTDVTLRVPVATQIRSLSVFEGRIELADTRGTCSARIERGDITTSRLGGIVRLETAIGNIRLDATSLTPDGLIRLRTFNGNVALELSDAPQHARILALSMGGTISSDIPLTKKERWGPRFGEATIGKGEPLISIDAVNGNIAITVARASR